MNQLERLELGDWPEESKYKGCWCPGCTRHVPSRIIWGVGGVPWWPSGEDSGLSLLGPGFNPWSGNWDPASRVVQPTTAAATTVRIIGGEEDIMKAEVSDLQVGWPLSNKMGKFPNTRWPHVPENTVCFQSTIKQEKTQWCRVVDSPWCLICSV